jgi:hypothetical protein
MPNHDKDFIAFDLLKERIREVILERICNTPGDILITVEEKYGGYCEVAVYSSVFDGVEDATAMLGKVLDEGLSRNNRRQVNDFHADGAFSLGG